MRNKFSNTVVSSVLVFVLANIFYVKCDNANCTVTGGGPDDCVNIYECPAVVNLLTNDTNSITNNTRDYLRTIQCGSIDILTPMVCCPPDTSLIDKTIVGSRKPYSHKNLHLLTKHDCGQTSEERIFGGTTVDLYEFPWMALLSYNNGITRIFGCGGSLITERYVLTAAHCINNQLLGVRIGEHDTEHKKDCTTHLNKTHCAPPVQDILIEESIKHKDYARQNVVNDIALIRLKWNADLSRKNSQPICLPIYNTLQNIQLEGQDVHVAGWGVTEKERDSDVLLKVSIKVIPNDDCINKFNEHDKLSNATLHISDHKICAGAEGKDSCNGDSGGPLIYQTLYDGKVRYVQYGIVSYGTKVCGVGTPGVYTKITKYLDWILDNMKP